MRKLLFILGLLVGISQAQTTTTITGTIKDLSQALVTSGKVTFTLQPSRDTTISGLARFSPAQVVCLINASGLIKAQDGTSVCTLTMNTALNPPGTYYRVDYWPFNVKTASFTFYAVLSTYDWSTVVPTPTTSPAQNFVDIFSTQTIGGNKTLTGNLTLQGTVLASSSLTVGGNFTATAGQNSITIFSRNGTPILDNNHYPCTTAGVQQAVLDASSMTGTVDAGGCTSLNITGEIDLHAITFMVPNLGTWTFSITDGTSCGYKMFDGATITGGGMSNGGSLANTSFRIQAIPTASADSMICSDPSPSGGGSYVRIQGGILLYNPSGGTFTHGLLHMEKLFDASSVRDVTVANPSGLGALFDSVCCGTTADKLVVDSENGVGASGLVIDSSGSPQSIAFVCRSCSIDHPGSAQHAIEIKSTSAQTGAVEFDNPYVEGNTTAQTASYIKNTASTGGITFHGGQINPRNSSETAYCFENANVSTNQLYIYGTRCAGAPATQNQINDLATSVTMSAPSAGGGLIYRYATIDPSTRSTRGTTTLSGGAATHNFSGDPGGNFQVAPICTASDTTAAAAVKASATATVLTLAGTTTDVIAWRCDGNPN